MRARAFPRCGAKTRKGTPCKAPPVLDPTTGQPRNGRCKCHGGLSTGPRHALVGGWPRTGVPKWVEQRWIEENRVGTKIETEAATIWTNLGP